MFLLVSLLIVVMVRCSSGFFTGFGNGLATDTVYDYLGVNSMVPFYTAMFQEMNNFDRSGGEGGIGMGTGLLQADGSIIYPTPAPPPASSDYGNSGYSSGSSNNGYGSSGGGGSYGGNSGYASRMFNRGISNKLNNMRGNGLNMGGMGGMFGGGGSSGGFGFQRRR